ncbi:MAG: hypothetical protein HY737_05680 [Candidatus Omnitrophica bacterium]|nr:hypothetical protein [Candidatus Omnitrophota bacterium]
MSDPLQPYRDALARKVHAVCLDRNLDPTSVIDTEAGCRIDRFLPELVQMVRQIRSDNLADYEAVMRERVCHQCGNLTAEDRCPVREQAECCLYRYLPLVIEAIFEVQGEQP